MIVGVSDGWSMGKVVKYGEPDAVIEGIGRCFD